MSSICSAASAASRSGLNGQECAPSRSAKSNHTAEPSSQSTGPMSPAMTTCAPSPQTGSMQTEFPWTSSAEASPARTSAPLDRAKALTARAADYGRSTPVSFANYDRAASSWKTLTTSFIEGLGVFSETWPRSGMTRNGIAYQLPPLVPLTVEIEFGSLPDAVKRWPTPKAQDSRHAMWDRGKSNLGEEIAELHNGRLNPTWVEWLMGFPLMWTVLQVSEMPLSRKSRKSSVKPSCKQKK